MISSANFILLFFKSLIFVESIVANQYEYLLKKYVVSNHTENITNINYCLH